MQQESEAICERHQDSCRYGKRRGAIYKRTDIQGTEKREIELCGNVYYGILHKPGIVKYSNK